VPSKNVVELIVDHAIDLQRPSDFVKLPSNTAELPSLALNFFKRIPDCTILAIGNPCRSGRSAALAWARVVDSSRENLWLFVNILFQKHPFP
jgi:hypothetical protein